MPAGRTCRVCGAVLPGDIRWCGRCYEPAREFTPRAPVHAAGTLAGSPMHTGGHAPHWSRWERSVTTFGPAGRLVATALLFLSVPMALSFGVFIYVFVFPLVAIPVLGSIWAKGWVVPDEPDLAPLPDPVPDDPVVVEPLTTARLVWRATWWTLIVGACAAFAYGPIQMKAAVLLIATLGGMVAFWRGFLSR